MNEPVDRPLGPDKAKLSDALTHVEEACHSSRLDLPVTLDYIPTVRSALEGASTYADIQWFVGQLRDRMHSELKSRLFLFVPNIEAGYYNQTEAFGSEVARKFPECISDVEGAGNGIALGMDTAAVFHLMRVMERGVQRFGEKLGVTFGSEKNWQNMLEEANKAIKCLPSTTPEEKSRQSELAKAASYLNSVKLAWRNPVMHPKASYSDNESMDVYQTVKIFMGHLASVI
jgi:hypothetical protein